MKIPARIFLHLRQGFAHFMSFLVAYSKKLLNYTTDGKHVVTKHTKLPQFHLIETGEIEGESKGRSITGLNKCSHFSWSIYYLNW
jgi:hypothetical protein